MDDGTGVGAAVIDLIEGLRLGKFVGLVVLTAVGGVDGMMLGSAVTGLAEGGAVDGIRVGPVGLPVGFTVGPVGLRVGPVGNAVGLREPPAQS